MKKLYYLFVICCIASCSLKGNSGQSAYFCNGLKQDAGMDMVINDEKEADFIKVGKTFMFRNVNYKNELDLPVRWLKADIEISFEENHYITVSIGQLPPKRYKAKAFSISHSLYGKEESNEININFAEGGFVTIHKLINGPYTIRNQYGVEYGKDEITVISAPIDREGFWGSFFDY